jgi:hypothetical protein
VLHVVSKLGAVCRICVVQFYIRLRLIMALGSPIPSLALGYFVEELIFCR